MTDFEKTLASYFGYDYAVATDTGSAAILLALKFRTILFGDPEVDTVELPSHTFVGVACAAKMCGLKIRFTGRDTWQTKGYYRLFPFPIIDSACNFQEFDAIPGQKAKHLRCLSFQYRKHLPIGRGGMVLTDDAQAEGFIRMMANFGRPTATQEPAFVSFNYYMEPERQARGLSLFNQMSKTPSQFGWDKPLVFDYPDLSKMEVFGEDLPS